MLLELSIILRGLFIKLQDNNMDHLKNLVDAVSLTFKKKNYEKKTITHMKIPTDNNIFWQPRRESPHSCPVPPQIDNDPSIMLNLI